MSLRLENARRLLARARDDAYILTRLATDPSAPDWPLGFHAQQAVEKALKAVLAARGVEYPLTHNLAMLVAKLAQHGVPTPPNAETLSRLTPFGVALRYDDLGEAEHVELDREWVAGCVTRTLTWAEATLAASDES
ncbi:MAG TPA: HEPN domain-containing protein [Phycisphaerae bacterium]|nr:HEPN domain-containing protein [Phycisphaerae bacterium]HNU44175.1 HEPN domain-containing protein [Phycisphaerae bacterium]